MSIHKLVPSPVTEAGDELLALAAHLVETGGVAEIPRTIDMLAACADMARTEEGQLFLVTMVGALIAACDTGDMTAAVAALADCPRDWAAHAEQLLLAAFFPDGNVDHDALDDAAMLCLVLLTAVADRPADAAALLDDCERRRSAKPFLAAAGVLRTHMAPALRHQFKPKLIVWDLDDTLWRGTLAEGDEVVLDEPRAQYVRDFNRHGIVSAICSKNDHETARARLEAFGLWDEFVFPRIAFVPKGEAVRRLVADMQLRAPNVLFIDDNPGNLHEVAAAVPGIQVVDARSPECDALLEKIRADHAHVAKSRVADYRVLQAKLDDREHSATSNAEFLQQSDIRCVFTRGGDNLIFAGRIEELVNRSNQLNYTESRVAPNAVADHIADVLHSETHCVFVWDKYGYYGLVGFASVSPDQRALLHFVFSCRVMHMGIEDALLARLRARYGDLDLSRLRKPLPMLGLPADVVTEVSFHEPAVRSRLLSAETPAAPAEIKLRIMCDCQSGALHHYSRFGSEAEFDNNPRLFSLPMMLTGEYRDQLFPRHLVYTAATDYVSHRWSALPGGHSDEAYLEGLHRFCDFLAEGDHRLLLFLPNDNAGDAKYFPHAANGRSFPKERGARYNQIWKDGARRYGDVISCIDLSEMAADSDLIDANHYVPPFLRRMSDMVEDWYDKHP